MRLSQLPPLLCHHQLPPGLRTSHIFDSPVVSFPYPPLLFSYLSDNPSIKTPYPWATSSLINSTLHWYPSPLSTPFTNNFSLGFTTPSPLIKILRYLYQGYSLVWPLDITFVAKRLFWSLRTPQLPPWIASQQQTTYPWPKTSQATSPYPARI